MENILDELVVAVGLDSKDFSAGERAVVNGLDRLTELMEKLVESFDTGEKKTSESLKKTGKNAEKTGKDMEAAGKKAGSFFSSIRSQVVALAGVSLSLAGIKNFVTDFTGKLNNLATAAGAFGMSAQSLDGWEKAGAAFGVTADEIVRSFSRISDAKGKLAAGYGLNDTLKDVMQFSSFTGANIDVFNDSTETIQRKIADNFKLLNPAQQRHFGQSLGWGYAGQQWLASGHATADVDRYTANSGVNDTAVAAARRFREEWAKISQSLEKSGYTLFSQLLPHIEKFNIWLDDLATWMAQHPEEISAALDNLLNTMTWLISTSSDAADAVGGWGNVIRTLIGLKLAGWLWAIVDPVRKLIGAVSGISSTAAGTALLTRLGLAGLVVPTNNTPNQTQEMSERDRLAKENWEKNNPGMPWPGAWKPSPADVEHTGNRLPRGIRNNNPGNLNYAGQAGASREDGPNGRFAVFRTMQDGIAALYRQMQLYMARGTDTLSEIVMKYAPSSDGNNVNAYISDLARKLGISADQKLDGSNIQQMITLIDGIISHENGSGFLSRADIANALPRPGAQLSSGHRNAGMTSPSTVTETTNIGTLNVNSGAGSIRGITDDAHQKISRSSLARAYSSGVSG